MKQHILSIVIAALAGIVTISSCTKLDVPVNSQLTSDNFPKTSAQFIAASLPAYTQLRAQYALAYWFMQEISTDEAIIPARGGNWYDNGKYKDLHLHQYTPDHEFVATSWSWGYNGISTCNRILKLFAPLPDNAAKIATVAELRTTRALFYYFMMDLYGNIPIVTTFGDTTLPATSPRTAVFDFIISELKEVLPLLGSETGSATYGRPTKWMAYALMAKMYLNAKYYIDKDMTTETVQVCDSIITSGKFTLDEDYLSMFKINNGPQIKDFIFAIPYDNVQAQGQYFGRYNLHFLLYNKFSMPFVPSNAQSTLPEFYALFNDAGDVRNNIWLAGPQTDYKGNPITVKTTKKGVDAGYSGSDPDAVVTWQLSFTPDVIIKDLKSFDVGNDMQGLAQGVRCNKFYPDSTSTTRNQSNDVPVFRYADVLLMKAEAILRGAAPTMGQTALSLVNQVRARAKAVAFENINLETLLDERGREFAYEAWRRNDLIRFEKFEGRWGYKTDTRTSRRIYPVPTIERAVNPRLGQNTDY